LDVTEEVVSKMRRRPVVLTGETDLAGTVAVLSVADLLVTNDTGPAHISAALERPTLVIFGPTNPLTTRPFSTTADIIRRPPDCAPCMLRDCPIDHRCMTAITPEEVFLRAVEMLAQHQCASQHGDHATMDTTPGDTATDASLNETRARTNEAAGEESTSEVGAEVA
jgi:heptosyltransferase-2